MIIDEAGFATMLFLSTTLLLGAASLAILRFQRLVRESAQLLSSGSAAQPKSKGNALEPLEQRLGALQKIVEDLARKEERPQQAGRHELPLENAVRMAKCGAGVDELTKSCGLKKGEAELLLRLHANREPAAGARAH